MALGVFYDDYLPTAPVRVMSARFSNLHCENLVGCPFGKVHEHVRAGAHSEIGSPRNF